MKQNLFTIVQPLPHHFSDTDAATSFSSYLSGLVYRIRAVVAAYLSLLKMRSATLNSLSALVGALIAVGSGIPWDTAAILAASVWLVAINSYLDRDIDRIMRRTSHRPLPSGVIKPAEKTLYLGISLIAVGLIISSLWLNITATLFIALGAVIYIFIYTLWLKRKTPWSVVIGGLAGSCALLAGWFSATTDFGLLPLVFSIFVFLWTLGHFWGLAIKTKEDSERANIPTLATRYGEKTAANWAVLSNIALIPISIIPYLLGIFGEVYLVISLSVGLIVLLVNIKLFFTPTAQTAWKVFKISSPYLLFVYLGAVMDILLI